MDGFGWFVSSVFDYWSALGNKPNGSNKKKQRG